MRSPDLRAPSAGRPMQDTDGGHTVSPSLAIQVAVLTAEISHLRQELAEHRQMVRSAVMWGATMLMAVVGALLMIIFNLISQGAVPATPI